MNYIDFAIAVSIFLFFLTMVLILSTNYFSNISGLTKISEFRTVSEGYFKLLFSNKGIPEDWEKTLDLNPVQLGLIEDLYRIPVLVKETSGYNRNDELISVNLVFDENCENKAWNNSIRVYDVDGNEIPFRISKETFCSNQFLKQAKIVWETNLTTNQNKKFYVYYSSDDSTHAPNYTDTFSTVAYWYFDEGSGNMSYDKTVNDNDGKLYNGTVWNSEEPTWKSSSDCKYGNCLSFDGYNDYIGINDSASLDITTEITVETWIKADQWAPDDYDSPFVTKASGADWGVWNLVHKVNDVPTGLTGFRFEMVIDGTRYQVWSATQGQTNQWYHLAGTFNGTTMRLYVNGVEEDSSVYPGTINTNDLSLQIGKQWWYWGNYSYFDGIIDEVRIWNRTLSPEEINVSYYSTPLIIKSFPEEQFTAISSSKVNALNNLNYEEILKTLGDYKFRIEISEIE